MRPDDGGSSRPPLPAEAGPTERTLYDVYDAQTGIVELTASDWATSAESVRGLSADVRGIVNALRGAPDAWSGPAAEAAYQTLGKLAENLDGHAEQIDRIEAGLTSAHDSVTAARTDYVTTVRSISLDVDQADYQRTPARQPAQPVPDGTVLDRHAYDQAVAGAKAAREKAAAAVLASFTDSMSTAARKLPVDPAASTPVQDGSSSTGGGGGSAGGGGTRPGGSRYLPPTSVGDPGWHPGGGDGPGGTDPGGTDPGGTDPGGTDPGPGGGGPGGGSTVVDPAPPVLDGSAGGTTGPGTPGGVGPVPGSTGAGAPAGPVGGGGAAAGVGGMMAGGGAAAMFGRGGMPGGTSSGGLAGRAGPATAAGRAGSAGSTGGAGSANRSSVLAGGGQGGAARSGAGGKGGGRTGRYGVPKLGERGGGRGVAGAAGGAGGRGAKGERDDAPDVDRLTLEDEETWFEGAEDATPPVWE